MKANESTFRTGPFNEFDQGFQSDMDNLIEQCYTCYEKSVAFTHFVITNQRSAAPDTPMNGQALMTIPGWSSRTP
jgi:hypothetical protein